MMTRYWRSFFAVLTAVGTLGSPAVAKSETEFCKISENPEKYLGKEVSVDALIINIRTHGIFFRSVSNDRCILYLGDPASGDFNDVLKLFYFPNRLRKLDREAEVHVHGLLKTEMRPNGFDGRLFRAYFLDQMTITRLKN